MLDDYCNESITVKTPSSTNKFNEQTYTERTIKARFEYKSTYTQDDKGEKVISTARLFTTESVTINDVVNYASVDWKVISISSMSDLDNDVIGYEVKL
jgi:hypothetical protein